MLDIIKGKKILAISPHPDDIEIGCVGTLMRLAKDNEIHLLIMSDGDLNGKAQVRREEARKACKFLGFIPYFGNLPDGNIGEFSKEVKVVEEVMEHVRPDIVFIPGEHDTHQDHRNTHKVAIAAGRRNPTFICYETPSTLNFKPNFFIDITDNIETKTKALDYHQSQTVGSKAIQEIIKMNAKVIAAKLRKYDKYYEQFEILRLAI